MREKIAIFAGNDSAEAKRGLYYGLAHKTGKLIAEAGFTVITGGGPGLMNEALRGAYENGGHTIGINLDRPGRKTSEYIRENFLFERLGPRQERMIELADGYVALPGGIGTLYEINAILALKRVNEIPNDKPLVLISEYYKSLKQLFDTMIQEGFIGNDLHDIYDIVDTPEQSVALLNKRFSISS